MSATELHCRLSAVLLLASLVKTQSPKIEVVCELIAKESIGYLSTSTDGNEYMSPAFASGHVFTPAMLDCLMAQSYYSPHVRSAEFTASAVSKAPLIGVAGACW